MIFGGIQKLTLLDYPGTVSCTLFTKGCNFRCPFCHNASLVKPSGSTPSYSEEEALDFLKKRQKILDGVCITGGEPLIHDSLPSFMEKVKALGYKIKLDTNGSFPEKLFSLVQNKLVDYVAMDIKNSFHKYNVTAGCAMLNLQHIEKSIDLLLTGTVPYEFRTTVASELHSPDDITFIAQRISGAEKYFIQNFADSGDILSDGFTPVSPPDLVKMLANAEKYVKNTKIR